MWRLIKFWKRIYRLDPDESLILKVMTGFLILVFWIWIWTWHSKGRVGVRRGKYPTPLSPPTPCHSPLFQWGLPYSWQTFFWDQIWEITFCCLYSYLHLLKNSHCVYSLNSWLNAYKDHPESRKIEKFTAI